MKLAITLKKLHLTCFFLITFTTVLHAEQQPLLIATAVTYPFVIQGKNQLYGYDITLMEDLCTIIKRDCKFKIMRFEQLLPAVINKEVDLALGAITITAERIKQVNFSSPYLVSKVIFLGQSKLSKVPFNLNLLENSTIGDKKGSIVAEILRSLNVHNPAIMDFNTEGDLIDALSKGDVDLVLDDESTALYWQALTGYKLIALGKPIEVGAGLGIAMNKDNIDLLQTINNALIQYENSNEFMINYRTYLGVLFPFQDNTITPHSK